MKMPTLLEIVQWDDATLINWRQTAFTYLNANPADKALRGVYDISTTELASRVNGEVSRSTTGTQPHNALTVRTRLETQHSEISINPPIASKSGQWELTIRGDRFEFNDFWALAHSVARHYRVGELLAIQ